MRAATRRSENTAQLPLWEQASSPRGLPVGEFPLDAFPLQRTLSFRWADGDISPEAAQRMLVQVRANPRRLVGVVSATTGHLVSLWADVRHSWIENGVVWGECSAWLEGAYIDKLRAGRMPEEMGDDEE